MSRCHITSDDSVTHYIPTPGQWSNSEYSNTYDSEDRHEKVGIELVTSRTLQFFSPRFRKQPK